MQAHGWSAVPGAACMRWLRCREPHTRCSGELSRPVQSAVRSSRTCSSAALRVLQVAGYTRHSSGSVWASWQPALSQNVSSHSLATEPACRKLCEALLQLPETQPLSGRPDLHTPSPVEPAPLLPGHPLLQVSCAVLCCAHWRLRLRASSIAGAPCLIGAGLCVQARAVHAVAAIECSRMLQCIVLNKGSCPGKCSGARQG